MLNENNEKTMAAKANEAFAQAGRDVIAKARAANSQVIVWRNGSIVRLAPDEAHRQLESKLASPG